MRRSPVWQTDRRTDGIAIAIAVSNTLDARPKSQYSVLCCLNACYLRAPNLELPVNLNLTPGPINKQLSIDISRICRKFYAAANAILCRTRFVSEMTRLCLFESFTLPLLTYGCEGIDMSAAEMQKLNVCWNNVYRKVFGMNLWESVKELQLFCNTLDCVRIVHTRKKLKFWFGLKLCDNKILYWCSKWLCYCYNAIFLKLCSEYNIDVGSNYYMNNVYLRFYHSVMDKIV